MRICISGGLSYSGSGWGVKPGSASGGRSARPGIDCRSPVRPLTRRCVLSRSTPDALWAAPSIRSLRPAAVVCRGLVRREGGRPLLDRFDLVVPVGARLLILSDPPESGSLLLRILAGLSRPDRGSVQLAGLTRHQHGAEGWARRVGYVGPGAAIWSWLSPAEALDLSGRLAGLAADERRRRIDAASRRYGFGGDLRRSMRRGGPSVMQRTALAAALLGDPEVLLLDEPLRAVDPAERERLLQVPGKRRTVLLASRLPASEAALVDQVLLIRDGRPVLHTTTHELQIRGLPLSAASVAALADLTNSLPASLAG